MQRLHHVHTVARGRLLQELNYGYDLVGNVKTLTNELGEATGRRSGAVSYTFDYDDLYRLTTATGVARARPGVIDQFKATYQFDEIHNMTQLDQTHWLTTANDLGTETAFPPHTNHHFAYAYGTAGPHQATKIGDTNVVYDRNGNTLRECRDHGDPTCTANGDHLRSFYWGEDDEMLAVIDGGGWNITRFMYDAGGNRVVKLGRGGESITIGQFFGLKGRKAATKHVFVGETRLASKLLPPPGWEPDWSEGTSPSGPIVQSAALVASATNDSGCDPSNYNPQKCPINPSPDPVIDRRLTDTKVRPETYYYHSDHLGSTSWVTDQNGRVHEHVDYFPYGEVWRDPRSDADGAPVKGQQFLFTSKELDEETGLYYFGARYYDPKLARWKSTDPADRMNATSPIISLNAYQYGLWSPIRFVDPRGRAEKEAHYTNAGPNGGTNVRMSTNFDKGPTSLKAVVGEREYPAASALYKRAQQIAYEKVKAALSGHGPKLSGRDQGFEGVALSYLSAAMFQETKSEEPTIVFAGSLGGAKYAQTDTAAFVVGAGPITISKLAIDNSYGDPTLLAKTLVHEMAHLSRWSMGERGERRASSSASIVLSGYAENQWRYMYGSVPGEGYAAELNVFGSTRSHD